MSLLKRGVTGTRFVRTPHEHSSAHPGYPDRVSSPEPITFPAIPSTLRRAQWGDVWRLTGIALYSTGKIFLKSPPLLILLAIPVVIWVLTLGLAVTFSGWVGLAFALATAASYLIAFSVLFGLAVLGHTAMRLAQTRCRLVLLGEDRGSALDIILTKRRQLKVANHGRLHGSSTAPDLREGAASIARELLQDGFSLDIRAQNLRVAQLYATQFPTLLTIGARDWQGHYRMEPIEQS